MFYAPAGESVLMDLNLRDSRHLGCTGTIKNLMMLVPLVISPVPTDSINNSFIIFKEALVSLNNYSSLNNTIKQNNAFFKSFLGLIKVPSITSRIGTCVDSEGEHFPTILLHNCIHTFLPHYSSA